MDELLDVVDDTGTPTGEVCLRSVCHERGIRHRTAHVWLVRIRDGRPQVLLQRRAQTKSHPGCLDISSAGHIPAGTDYLESALRELQEELGCEATPDELVFCGNRQTHFEGEFFGRPFRDHQYVRVYLIWRDQEKDAFHLQESEVEDVFWMDLKECMEGVAQDAFRHCIALEELEMVERTLSDSSV